MTDFTLPRNERLRSLSAVRRLLAEGRSGFVYPFLYVFISEPCQTEDFGVLFSVPKRMHKRAVRRNLLRRRAKEAYRLNKHILHAACAEGRTLHLALVYSSKDIAAYKTVDHAIGKILQEVAAGM